MKTQVPAQRFYIRIKRDRLSIVFDIEELVAVEGGTKSLRTPWALERSKAADVLQMLKSGTYRKIPLSTGSIELSRPSGADYVIFDWVGEAPGDDIHQAHCLDGGQMDQLISDLENYLK